MTIAQFMNMPDDGPTFLGLQCVHKPNKTAAPYTPKLCMHIVTFGQCYRRNVHIKDAEIINSVDCARLRPPPREICAEHTGLDQQVSNIFFSDEQNNAVFHQKLHEIQAWIATHPKHNGCVAVLVSCRIGVHRSVAMAERLAKELRRRNGIMVTTKHLDKHLWVKKKMEEIDWKVWQDQYHKWFAKEAREGRRAPWTRS